METRQQPAADRDYEKDWCAYGRLIDARRDAPEWRVNRLSRDRHYRAFFELQEGAAVLDAGCGHGDYAIYALQDGARVWAFDYSPGMVELTRERAANQGLKPEAVTRDSVTRIPYASETFDAVFCLAVLDHLPEAEREQAMGELRRVLKPQGILYVDVPNRLAYHWRLCFTVMRWLRLYPAGKIHFYTPWELRHQLRRHGFAFQRSLGMTFCPPFSGIYTTDIRRLTVLPEFLIRPLDRLYLSLECTLRNLGPFKAICWHYFVAARKE